MKILNKRVWLILLVVTIGIQFVPVERSNPPITEEISVPPDVAVILKRSCYDCHSHQTVWPWYSKVAPISWLVSNHVNEGRKHLNFSTWNRYSRKDQLKLLEELVEETGEGEMPLWSYTLLHSHAKLGPADIRILKEWAESLNPPHREEEEEESPGEED